MEMVIHGAIQRPMIAVVGTFDPFLPAQAEMLQELSEYARENSLQSVAVVLDRKVP